MPSNSQYTNALFFAAYSFICFLFFYKYSYDLHPSLVFLIIPYLGGLYFFTRYTKGDLFSEELTRYAVIGLNIGLCIASAGLFFSFSVDGLSIDRYSVVTNYWDTYFMSENPYSSQSHVGNHYGSYPFYFWMMLPFYLLGELGWAPVLGLIGFQVLVYQYFKSYTAVLLALILGLASIALPYEIATRSSIFYNSVAVLAAAYWFYKSWQKDRLFILSIAAFFIGCLVSSRPIFGLVFAMLGIFLCRTAFDKNKIAVSAIASVIGAALPFIHLYVLFPETFIQFNPVSYTAVHFVPMWMQIVFVVVGLGLAFRITSFSHFVRLSTYFLLFVVLAYMTRHFVLRGWHRAIFGNYLDLTYFILPLPFLLFSIVLLTKPKQEGSR